MAFNPFTAFQKNKRFWMAAILIVCMVTFVFCTGMRGDMSDRFLNMFKKRGATVATVGGYSMSNQDLHALKDQRNFANTFILNCCDIAYKKMSKRWFDEQQKAQEGKKKDDRARAQMLAELQAAMSTLWHRKSRPRYFDGGVKFDDLLEFKLWQVQADRLGVHLEDIHVERLFHAEFFHALDIQEVEEAKMAASRNFQQVNSSAFAKRAIAEEFRVQIAKLATAEAQPFPFLFRGGKQDDILRRFGDPSVPNEVRAPMTPGQLLDYFQKNRTEFDVTLIPVAVKDFEKQIKETPNEIERRQFFDANKNKPMDPSSDDYGLERPGQIKIEYLVADPTKSEFRDVARLVADLKRVNPFGADAVHSPVVAALRYAVVARKQLDDLQNQYELLGRDRYLTTRFSHPGSSLSIMTRLAKQEPGAAASIATASLLDPVGSLAAYMHWGAAKHPDQLEAAERAELKRRAPVFATIWGTVPMFSSFEVAGPLLAMDLKQIHPAFPIYQEVNPELPIEAVQHEISDMITRRQAEETAQENIREMRRELERAAGDAEKFRRVLMRHQKDLKLSHGPEKKDSYYNKFNVLEAPELEPLRKAYDQYMHLINSYEGRDLTPERVLKREDFWKLLFDSNEDFAAVAPYRAMPWPPEVNANQAFLWKGPDPRALKAIGDDNAQKLREQLLAADPTKKAPKVDLFTTASMPILFWRTAELPAQRYADYPKLSKDLQKAIADLKTVEESLKSEKDSAKILALQKRKAELQRTQADLSEIETRIVEGWKLDRARSTLAIPEAKNVAKKLIEAKNPGGLAIDEASRLKQALVSLPDVSLLHAERFKVGLQDRIEYTTYPLPKDKLVFPRDDMLQQVLSLAELKEPIKTGNKEIDDVNKELFETIKKQKDGNTVQILANKPRNIFYVALVVPADRDKQHMRNLRQDIELTLAWRNASYRSHMPDQLIARAQQEEARRMRAEYVGNLQRVLGFNIENAEARKEFDDRVGE